MLLPMTSTFRRRQPPGVEAHRSWEEVYSGMITRGLTGAGCRRIGSPGLWERGLHFPFWGPSGGESRGASRSDREASWKEAEGDFPSPRPPEEGVRSDHKALGPREARATCLPFP